jgi:hypothetical protein
MRIKYGLAYLGTTPAKTNAIITYIATPRAKSAFIGQFGKYRQYMAV